MAYNDYRRIKVEPSVIREVRAALGESTETFGKRFAVSGRTVEGWEQGRREPSLLIQRLIQELWDAQCRTRKKAPKKKRPG